MIKLSSGFYYIQAEDEIIDVKRSITLDGDEFFTIFDFTENSQVHTAIQFLSRGEVLYLSDFHLEE